MRLPLACLLFAGASNASAAVIPYSFTAEVDAFAPGAGERLGLGIGDTITGGFYFDEDAPLLSLFECVDCSYDGSVLYPGVRTESTYDMSALTLWANLNGNMVGASGTELFIRNSPGFPAEGDEWRLGLDTGQQQVAGMDFVGMLMLFQQSYGGGLSHGGLQVADPLTWPENGFLNNRLVFFFDYPNHGVEGLPGIGSHFTSINKSVPEPATLSLLAAGLIALLRRRKARL